MAKDRKVNFRISLITKDYKKGLKKVVKGSQGFVSRLKKIFTPIKNLIFGPLSAGVIAIGASFRKLTSIISEGAQNFIDLESAFADINTLIEGPGGVTENTKKMIREMAVVYGTTALDNARAYYDVVSAGITDQTEALKLLNTANKIALTGNENVANATKALVSVMKAYGANTVSAAKAGDVLQTVVNKGITTWPELAGYISTVASSAKGAGVELEELAMMVAGLTAKGLDMSRSMTAIKGILNTLVKGPGPEARKMMDDMGISFDIATVKQKGFTAVMQEMLNAMGGDSEKLAVLFREMEALTGAVSLNAEEWAKLTEQFKNTQGALDKGMADKIDTLANKMDKLKRIQEKLLEREEFGEFTLWLETVKTKAIAAGIGILSLIQKSERLQAVLTFISGMQVFSLIAGAFNKIPGVADVDKMMDKKKITLHSEQKKETEQKALEQVKAMEKSVKRQEEMSQKIKDAYTNIRDLTKESIDKIAEGVEKIRQKTLDAIQKIKDAFLGGGSLGGAAEKARLLKGDYKAQASYERIRGKISGAVGGQGMADIARTAKGITPREMSDLLRFMEEIKRLGKVIKPGDLAGLMELIRAGGDLKDIKKELGIAVKAREKAGVAEEQAFKEEAERKVILAAENQLKASDKNIKSAELMEKVTEQMKKAIEEHRKVVNTPITLKMKGELAKYVEQSFENSKRTGTAGPGITRVG